MRISKTDNGQLGSIKIEFWRNVSGSDVNDVESSPEAEVTEAVPEKVLIKRALTLKAGLLTSLPSCDRANFWQVSVKLKRRNRDGYWMCVNSMQAQLQCSDSNIARRSHLRNCLSFLGRQVQLLLKNAQSKN